MKATKVTFQCDHCGADLPSDHIATDKEGYQYYARSAYDEITLSEPLNYCNVATVHVQLGGRCDPYRYNDLCDTCRLLVLRQAVEYLEQKVGGDYAREEPDTGTA